MAKSRPSQRSKQPQPESKKALIIFLVFFILTTIGGGLFGYQGYIADEGKAAKIKEVESAKKAAEDQRDFNNYEALLYRRLLGQEKSKETFDKLDRQFKEGTEGWTQNKDRNDLLAVLDAVEKRLKAVAPDKGAPPKDFTKALEIQVQEKKAALAAIGPFKKDKNAGDESAAESKALLEDAKVQYAKALAKVTKDLNDARDKEQVAKKELEANLKGMADKLEAKSKEYAEYQKKTNKDAAAQRTKLNSLQEELTRTTGELDKLRSVSHDLEVPDLQVKAVGKVVERRGDSVFIDLGQIQKLTPQLTFSVHGVSGDGQPLPTSKGSIEVVNIFESGAQCRVLIEKNKSDPIRQGDILVNPNWDPNRKRHVAIAGMIDLTGEGRNQLREFRQLLERQNIVVDAYLESTSTNWVPQGKGVTRETNYLILGEELPESKDPMAKLTQLKDTEVFKQAKANGVLVLNLRNYLDLIGYQPPRGSGESSAYRPGVVSYPDQKVPPPAPPAPPPMKDPVKNPKP